jgi:TonB family protein
MSRCPRRRADGKLAQAKVKIGAAAALHGRVITFKGSAMRIASVPRLITWLFVLTAQGFPDDAPNPIRVGPGVTPPKVQYRPEPEYSREALNAGIQGTVVFEVVVNEAGRLVNVSVVSPLGFGLDEKAQETIAAWRFEPGRKDGKPVSILATVEVNFRLQGQSFDSKAEDRRVRFNVALAALRGQDTARRNKAMETLEELAKQNFPPAMYVLGKLLEAGDVVASDPERAGLLIRKAADKRHGPALFDLGLASCEGKGVPKDAEKGMRMLRDAANLGSYAAQFYLGNYYEQGPDASRDLDRARRSFRLCAAAGHADCQVRLAKLLLGLPQRQDRDYVQAIAWLKLAADQGQTEAQSLVDKEGPGITPEQLSAVLRLKAQLVHKQ